MSYQREKYQEYLQANGIYNASPYCSCLDKIEKTLNVDIDKEMTDLAETTIYYQTLQAKAASELSQLNIAITGSR